MTAKGHSVHCVHNCSFSDWTITFELHIRLLPLSSLVVCPFLRCASVLHVKMAFCPDRFDPKLVSVHIYIMWFCHKFFILNYFILLGNIVRVSF